LIHFSTRAGQSASVLLMAVGFWNVLGAGAFGSHINMPIASYH
jgi:nitric oxide reductase large subunit